MPSMNWSRPEVEALVSDYLRMLVMELNAQAFSKTGHRNQLLRLLNKRSAASIEFKHCNVSAALMQLGYPSIQGYRPRFNYQTLIAEVVLEQVRAHPTLDSATLAAVQQAAVPPAVLQFAEVSVMPPNMATDAGKAVPVLDIRPFKRDYLERESVNASLGLAGEQFVCDYERWRLKRIGLGELAKQVEHVSQTKGDGLGYDVLSFGPNGDKRLIEVKTTTFGKETPFFISHGELHLSELESAKFHLYRVFDFRKSPRLFDLPGPLHQHCLLKPISYRASFS